MAESKGTWLDTKTGKIVSSEPEEGVQLLAPGVEATPADQARIDAVKASLAGDTAEPKPVTTQSTTATAEPATPRRATGQK